MSIIKTARVSRHYGRRIGIDAVNLDVGDGEIFGFLGPNGAGKTTTIRILLGFLRPDAGSATISGLDCWSESAQIKRDVGYLPGDLRLYSWFTVNIALEIIGHIRGIDLREDGARLAKRFQLEMDLPVRKMSRGMRQKLGLLLALVHQPRLVILDEPTSGLDPLVQEALAELLRELAAAGHTIFFSSHTLSEVENLCHRVAIVREGRIVADERLESLRGRARRTVELSFADEQAAASVQLPPFLELTRRDAARLRCELDGPTGPLIQWASGQQLSDIAISQPDLESLFHKFYQSPHEAT